MRAALRPRGVLLHRIENIVGEGIPDVVAAYRGNVTFIELKAIDAAPVRATTPALGEKRGLSAAQKNWHHDWNAAGCVTLILIGIGREIAAIDGSDADLVNAMSAGDVRRVSLANTWESLAELLGAR
jgi:hypothetical protein